MPGVKIVARNRKLGQQKLLNERCSSKTKLTKRNKVPFVAVFDAFVSTTIVHFLLFLKPTIVSASVSSR